MVVCAASHRSPAVSACWQSALPGVWLTIAALKLAGWRYIDSAWKAEFLKLLCVVAARKPLSPVLDGQHIENELDRHLRLFREAELVYIGKSARKLRETSTDIKEALSEAETFLALLKNLATEVRQRPGDYVTVMPVFWKFPEFRIF